MEYDYVIIGNTPRELIATYYLSKNNKKILFINPNEIGNCSYSVFYKDNYYIDNGPTIYSDSFVNFRKILKELDLDFYSEFRKTEKQFNLFNLDMNERLIILNQICQLFCNNYESKEVNCLEFMNKYNMKNITDFEIQTLLYYGKELSEITLYDFIQMINKQLMYHYSPE